MSRIFDPYFTTKEKGSGTGLGLALVHAIVKSHDGMIKIESRVDRGTRVNVYLPLLKDDIAGRVAVLSTGLPRGHERILFVDDEKDLADLGARMLAHLGYRALARTGSLEALELFRERPQDFDLVITDMTMPGMTGDRLAREMIGIRPDIPIVMCSGFSEVMTEDQARRTGIRAFAMRFFICLTADGFSIIKRQGPAQRRSRVDPGSRTVACHLGAVAALHGPGGARAMDGDRSAGLFLKGETAESC